MLPAQARLTDGAGFAAATRGGQRAGGRGLVVHLGRTPDERVARIGLIVNRGVGGSVVRNRVKRRLRHLLRTRLAVLPPGSVIAVRALPRSATMSSCDLGRDLDRCLARLGVSVSSAPTPSSETVTA